METIKNTYQSVLTIAGSDSGGCAGIQADIKSISACGAYAASVITATTAQNTVGVTDIHAIPIAHLKKQMDAVFSDIQFGAVKIGMLHSADVIAAVEEKLVQYNAPQIVLDPVMVATSGDQLIDNTAVDRLKKLLTKATLITPNIPEATILMGTPIDATNITEAATAIGEQFQTSVLLKGGHLSNTDTLVDVLYHYPEKTVHEIQNPKIATNHTHGTGCSLSSSIAAFLCLGYDLETAVRKGCAYIHEAIIQGKDLVLGKGNGPINHFHLKPSKTDVNYNSLCKTVKHGC